MKTPNKWKGMQYPDSHLISLIHKLSDKKGYAVDLGCSSGRHVKLLSEIGFDAIGIEQDLESINNCHNNHIPVINSPIESVSLPETPELLVAWGITPLGNIAEIEKLLASFKAKYVILDWRTKDNFFYSARDTIHHNNNTFTIGKSGQHLAGLKYRIHEKNQCHLPGYERTFIQKVEIKREVNDINPCNCWYQTIHKLIH